MYRRYQDKLCTPDFAWGAETSDETGIFQSAEKSVYYSEMNTLMEQLLGNKPRGSDDETILLDLFSDENKTE